MEDYSYINEKCLCLEARKQSRIVTQCFNRHLKKTGLKITQLNVLVAFLVPGINLNEIANSLGLERSTLSRNIEPLLRLGLLRQYLEANLKDRRSRFYSLTSKGREVLEQCAPLWREAQISCKL